MLKYYYYEIRTNKGAGDRYYVQAQTAKLAKWYFDLAYEPGITARRVSKKFYDSVKPGYGIHKR